MNECLADLEQRVHRENDALPLLVKIALAHYQFEAIHPFRDGNGRVGRLLIPLMLVRSERLAQPILYLSAYLERHRQTYMDLMLAVSRDGEWLPWVSFFLKGVAESANETVAHVEALLSLRARYREQFRSSRSFGYLERLIDDLLLLPSTTIARAAVKLGVTQAAASAHIKKLVDAGLLSEWTGRKRNQVFIAPEILAFMQKRKPDSNPFGGSA